MRSVRRRFTRRKREWSPPAPWTVKEDWPWDAPRCMRSNYYWPVMVRGVEVGIIDRALHLYQHWGLTRVSATVEIDGKWRIIYDSESEWSVVLSFGFWIEFVDDFRQVTARISREDALRFGHATEHGNRSVWAVPFDKYTTHRRDR